jgi:hypothetical protein
MKMINKQVHFLRQSFLKGFLLLAFFPFFDASSQQLPWQREIPLKEAALTVTIKDTLNATDPFPDWSSYPLGHAMAINNLKMRTTIWGPTNRITISLMKNNVWDRRINPRALTAPTVQEITEGAYSPANKGYEGRSSDSQRPRAYGYLLKEGGSYDPYRQPYEYPMPCQKPVGQIIMGIDQMKDAEAPEITQSCANGFVKLRETSGNSKAVIQYVLGMTSDIYAIRGEFMGINSPVWLRLFRHRDTAHEGYMTPDGKKYTRPGTEADSAFNYPMEPPTSGTDGRYFWIRQKFPAEKTFPKGFEYVLMGVVITPGKVNIETIENQLGLGTAPPDKRIANAPGAAATAIFTPTGSGRFEALVTVVTTLEGADVMATAKNRLAMAQEGGFDGILKENTQWWNAFYDMRENGRVYSGLTGADCTEEIMPIYRSYADSHGGGTKTDMTRYECSAKWVVPEQDTHPWSSSPCYNEVFTSMEFVGNRGDNQDMWKQLVSHYTEAGRDNAKNMFGAPGMAILHGYQPPVKADKFVHTTITLEFCLETLAGIIKPAWDEWDYGGDIEFLRRECYPMMREMALFYAAYVKKGDDGYYHIIPSMEPERWGWYYEFARNKDVISSLCMFRWALNRTAETSEILNVDADLREKWREIASNIAPYPIWETQEGPVFAAINGVEPRHEDGDHDREAHQYPTILADEINLDSPTELKEMMYRTCEIFRIARITRQTLLLLGYTRQDWERDNKAQARYDLQFRRLTDTPESEWNGDVEALLNSRSGRIHLFPAIAPEKEIAFRNFQTRGAFLVSAAKNSKEVYFLNVEARNDNVCQIMNPWPDRSVIVIDSVSKKSVKTSIDKSNGECIVFPAKAGCKYSINAL